jgi:hypothetical protein
MKELLALAIDRATSAKISEINYEIGHSVYDRPYGLRNPLYNQSEYERLLSDLKIAEDGVRLTEENGRPSDYASLLYEYVELKLHLHKLRRHMFWKTDIYCEREDVDCVRILTRCAELKQQIKAMRRTTQLAAWGGLEPTPRPTLFDKPILHAMDEHTCSHMFDDTPEDEDSYPYNCQLNAEHWYRGRPYCRMHFGEAKKRAKLAKRWQKRVHLRNQGVTEFWTPDPPNPDDEPPRDTRPALTAAVEKWTRCGQDGCDRKRPHWHCFGRVHY